mmetsp:Transcript_25078/g.62145  ORF Transcript_25078/g.62145 Transcript_25078/m.62145 type:complete len:104 (+) Transcript_25078:267-578(+)
MHNLARCNNDGNGCTQDQEAARRLWSKAADLGDEMAQTSLAWCYYLGTNGCAQDYAASAQLWRQAAEKGELEAQDCYGDCCFTGEGIAQDVAAAVRQFRLAAD